MRAIFVLLLCLLVDVTYAQSQQVPQTPQIPSKSESDSITKTYKRTNNQQQNTTKEPAIREKNQSENNKTNTKREHNECQKNNSEYSIFFGRCFKFTDFFLMVFTGLLFLVTAGLIYIGIRQELHLRNTARKELRPYLTLKNFNYFSHLDTAINKYFWSIHPVWENSGNTPTKMLFLNVSYCLRNEPLPRNFDFPDAEGDPIQMVTGPKITITAVPGAISGEDLIAVRNSNKFFYIWGWAKYIDIFARTPEHITRFCNQITRVTGNPTEAWNREINPVEITFSVYRENNCIDEGCD